MRDAIHFGALIEHKHTRTGEEALPVAYLTKNEIIIDMLRGLKIAQTPRIMQDSFVDGCIRGVVGQLERMLEWNKLDPEWRVTATGHSGLTAAAEAGKLNVVKFLIESVRPNSNHTRLGVTESTGDGTRGTNALRVSGPLVTSIAQ